MSTKEPSKKATRCQGEGSPSGDRITKVKVTYNLYGSDFITAPVTDLPMCDVGDLEPVREPQPRWGQWSNGGWLWSHTTGDHIPYESRFEYLHLVELDFDPEVVWIVGQPFTLAWRIGGRPARHTPDFLVQLNDGECRIVNVSRPEAACREEVAQKHRACAMAADRIDWESQVVTSVDPTRIGNIRYLMGHRIQPIGYRDFRELILKLARVPVPIRRVLLELGSHEMTRSAVLHMLSIGELETDLEEPLSDEAKVWRGTIR